jgi:hypothetical protein
MMNADPGEFFSKRSFPKKNLKKFHTNYSLATFYLIIFFLLCGSELLTRVSDDREGRSEGRTKGREAKKEGAREELDEGR